MVIHEELLAALQVHPVPAVTLTVQGGAGTDVSVAAGSTLGLTGANAITLQIASGANGDISGTTNLAGSAHRLRSSRMRASSTARRRSARSA